VARDNRSRWPSWDGVADRGVVPMMEAKATSQPEGRPRPERTLGGSARDRTQGRVSLPAKLVQVNEAARRSRQTRFTALLHHVDDEALLRAFRRQRWAASAGVDGVTVADYEQNLDAIFGTSATGFTPGDTGHSRCAAPPSPKPTAGGGLSAYRPWRTRSSRVRWPRC